MNSVDGDPELAQEVVKLLGNELKSVRQQLKELQAIVSMALHFFPSTM